MKDNALTGSGLFAKSLVGNYGLMEISNFETVTTVWILDVTNTVTPQPIDIRALWTTNDIWLDAPYFYR